MGGDSVAIAKVGQPPRDEGDEGPNSRVVVFPYRNQCYYTASPDGKERRATMRIHGHFYRFDDCQEQYSGRSTLEIVRTPFLSVDEFLCSVPDIVVIMMNPGSSEPRDPQLNPELVADPALVHHNPLLVDTIPDETQCSILQLMEHKSLSHVRVLNLSDIREANSAELLKKLTRENPNIGRHSIFSETRCHELQLRLRATLCLAVLAWGKDTRLRFLAEACVNALPPNYKRLGQRVHQDYHLYSHPWQRSARAKAEWIDAIIDQWPH